MKRDEIALVRTVAAPSPMKSIRVCGSGKKRCPVCWDAEAGGDEVHRAQQRELGHVQLKVEAREAAKHVADPCVEVEEYYKAKHSITANDNYPGIHSQTMACPLSHLVDSWTRHLC